MKPLLFLEYPDNQVFYRQGASVKLLKDFFDFIDRQADKISEIYLCLYLYNNSVLHEKMKTLAKKGIKVTVISIPLEGYDDRNPKDIYDYETNQIYRQNATKYSLASEIYRDIENLNSINYTLLNFEHIYVRSPYMKSFSRGMLPYSLHTKSIYIKYKDGNTVTGLTSSNLAVRDASKAELMLLAKDTPASRKVTETFFENLLRYSVRPSDWKNPHPAYYYKMETVDGGTVGANYFTAPFIQDSPMKIEEKLREIIFNAQERIYICAQHLAAFNYDDINRKSKPGIFGTIFEKCRQGIEVKCLSQTYVDANGDSHNQRKPQNSANFIELINQVNQLEHCSYSVNQNVHAKFIVADDTVIVGTGNYTPTEFIYGNVSIDHFAAPELNGVSYKGIFSEVAHYMIIKDHELAEQLIRFFNVILAKHDTYVHGAAGAVQTSNKFYINCPYAEKDDAKRLGASWDPSRRKWYYTDPQKKNLFQRWL